MSNLNARFFRFFKYLNIRVISEVLRRSGQHRLSGLSAEIAYNAVFALFPAILVVLTAIGLLNIPDSEFRHFTYQVSGVIPNEAMALIQKVLPQLSITRNRGIFSLSFMASIWVSSSVLGATMAALDQVHQIPRDRVRPFWKAKLVSIGLSLGTFLLLVIALLVLFISDVSVTVVAQRSGTMAPSVFRYWHLLSLPIALGIVALSLGFIYRFGTSRWRKGTPIMPGAILAALLWAVLSGLLRFYVARFGHFNQTYSAIGAAIILLLWLYLSAFAMLLGSELNVVVGDAMRQKSRQRKELVK
ncbi:MAG: YihY/virulence factor BrkB family protein [Myxacorys chilensis ATA2-1-KO14]|nr:YihY/virulence factor BrkB family protein [Myxacorys chilensis ATA2-1-KO14]